MSEEELLQYIFCKARNDLISLGIPVSDDIDPKIRISRAQRKWGSCKLSKKPGDHRFHISISENCFKEPDYVNFIRNTMAHELIHTVEGCFNHGAGFKAYGKIAEKLGYEITVSSKSAVEKSDEEKFNEAKHVLKCTECGQMYYRLRFPKARGYINKIRCGRCRGRLIKVK